MKRLIAVTMLLLTGMGLFAQQGKVSTRRYKFSDFTDKITKVVMNGGDILDAALRQAVVDRWTASPFEFCTLDEYENLRKSGDWYFLLVTEGRDKDGEEDGLRFLTLEKGGADTGDSVDVRTEVISLPLCPTSEGNGRELVFLTGMVQSIQDFTLKAMTSEKVAYARTAWFNRNYEAKGRIKRICLSREDIAAEVTDRELEKYLDEDILLCGSDEADSAYTARTYNTLVSYTVARGEWSYQMLFEADTDILYYIRRHKVTAKSGPGFLADDLRRISRGR